MTASAYELAAVMERIQSARDPIVQIGLTQSMLDSIKAACTVKVPEDELAQHGKRSTIAGIDFVLDPLMPEDWARMTYRDKGIGLLHISTGEIIEVTTRKRALGVG